MAFLACGPRQSKASLAPVSLYVEHPASEMSTSVTLPITSTVVDLKVTAFDQLGFGDAAAAAKPCMLCCFDGKVLHNDMTVGSAHLSNGDRVFIGDQAAVRMSMVAFLRWLRDARDTDRMVIEALDWLTRRKLCCVSVEWRSAVERARGKGHCVTRMRLKVDVRNHGQTNVLQICDPRVTDERWIDGATLTTPRCWGYTCTVLDGKLYVIGGHSGHSGLNSVDVFEPRPTTSQKVARIQHLKQRIHEVENSIHIAWKSRSRN